MNGVEDKVAKNRIATDLTGNCIYIVLNVQSKSRNYRGTIGLKEIQNQDT